MSKYSIVILFALIAGVVFGQARLVKPEAEELDPRNVRFLPQYDPVSPSGEQLDGAIAFYEKEIENVSGREGAYNQGKILYCIAELHRLNGNHPKAITILLQSAHAVGDHLNPLNAARLNNRLIMNCVSLDEPALLEEVSSVIAKEMGFSGFEEMLDHTAEVLMEESDEQNLAALYHAAWQYYYKNGNDKKAYTYGNRLIEYRKEMASRQLKREQKALEDIYQMTQKETEIQLLNNQKKILDEKIAASKQQQWGIIGGILVLLLLSLMLLSRVRTIRRTRDLLAAKAAQYQHEKNRAQKNEIYKEQFLANVSHEIRTPMNAILGITNILIRNKHPESQNKYLTAMQESAKNLLVLINDILDLSKLGAGKLELVVAPFNPHTIAGDVYEKMEEKARKKGLEFEYSMDDEVPELLSGDGQVLSNILMNLMNNAISFTSNGGVGLLCRRGEERSGMLYLHFEIRDTGVGIVPEKQDKVLKTFVKVYDTDSIKYEGSGLELAIINQMVELKGGSIRLESAPNEGTTFILDIPYILDPETEEAGEPMPDNEDDSLSHGELSILLVEDNEFNVMVATTELETAMTNIKLDVAENGKVALGMIEEGGYDLVLMDVQMPVMDGYEATRKIRSLLGNKSKIPIIAMTANVLQQEVEKCIKEGMDDYISKPFDTDELVKKIRKLVRDRD